MGNSLVTFGAVYAPSNARAGLFTKLHDQVKRLDSQCTWLGGDWNTSYSTLPPNLNPDIENHGVGDLRRNIGALFDVSDPLFLM